MKRPIQLLTLLTAAVAVAAPPAEKKIFAHYMGCLPLQLYPRLAQQEGFESARPGATDYRSAIGGKYFSSPLLPPDWRADPVEAAALDIRRALRAGIDGFAVDLSGRELAPLTLRSLIRAAEKYDLPFEISLALDGGYRNAGIIKLLCEEFRDSPKLARRNGKILLFGYNSGTDAEQFVHEYFLRKRTGRGLDPAVYRAATEFPGLPQLSRAELDFPELTAERDLWNTPAGWRALAAPFRFYERSCGNGERIAFQFELTPFTRNGAMKPDLAQMRRVIAVLSSEFEALGNFLPATLYDEEQMIELAAIAREHGAEWGEAVCYQYDRPYHGRLHCGPIVETMLKRWELVEKTGATLLQFTTWNDYCEGTMLAPTPETRYVHGELNAWFVQRWKTGQFPEPREDTIMALYHKYPVGAERDSFPFRAPRIAELKKVLEVVTMLTAPGRVTLPERGIAYDAPAGFHYRQFPLTPGPVTVRVERAGKVAKELVCGEPIVSERVFRPEQTPTAWSTSFQRFWREDFGEAEPVSLEGFYAVRPGSVFPNWFRMVYFGTMGDFRKLPEVDPGADPDGDGATNLEEYLRQTDPTRPDRWTYEPGFRWEPGAELPPGFSFNPDRDRRGRPVWSYGADGFPEEEFREFTDSEASGGDRLRHRFPARDRAAEPWQLGEDPRLPKCALELRWRDGALTYELKPDREHGAGLRFRAPTSGIFTLSFEASAPKGGHLRWFGADSGTAELAPETPLRRTVRFRAAEGETLTVLAAAGTGPVQLRNLTVQKLSEEDPDL